jgi:hypothetical protein
MCFILFDRLFNWFFGCCFDSETNEDSSEKNKAYRNDPDRKNYIKYSLYEMKKKDLINDTTDKTDKKDNDDNVINETNNSTNNDNKITIINIMKELNNNNLNSSNDSNDSTEWEIINNNHEQE